MNKEWKQKPKVVAEVQYVSENYKVLNGAGPNINSSENVIGASASAQDVSTLENNFVVTMQEKPHGKGEDKFLVSENSALYQSDILWDSDILLNGNRSHRKKSRNNIRGKSSHVKGIGVKVNQFSSKKKKNIPFSEAVSKVALHTASPSSCSGKNFEEFTIPQNLPDPN